MTFRFQQVGICQTLAFIGGLPADVAAQEGLEVHGTVVRCAITLPDDTDRAGGPVAQFDTAAFRGALVDRGLTIDPTPDPATAKSLVLPREYIDWRFGERTLGLQILDEHHFDSSIDRGDCHGYRTYGATYRRATTVSEFDLDSAQIIATEV